MNEIAPSRPDAMPHSVAMERMIEMAVLAELTQEAWFGRGQVFDVMHSTVDAYGHDVVLEGGSALRHVQLKARQRHGATTSTKINVALADRPSGCVIWTSYDQVPGTNKLSLTYHWFGGAPDEPLPPLGDRFAKHTKANAQGVKAVRPNVGTLLLTQFTPVDGPAALLDLLFGPTQR